MADVDPALVAQMDQNIAVLDEAVPNYVAALADLIATHGRENALALFTTRLEERYPPGVLAILAAGALARLV